MTLSKIVLVLAGLACIAGCSKLKTNIHNIRTRVLLEERLKAENKQIIFCKEGYIVKSETATYSFLETKGIKSCRAESEDETLIDQGCNGVDEAIIKGTHLFKDGGDGFSSRHKTSIKNATNVTKYFKEKALDKKMEAYKKGLNINKVDRQWRKR